MKNELGRKSRKKPNPTPEDLIEAYRHKIIKVYGRANVPAALQVEVTNFAMEHNITPKVALERLVTDAGTFDALVEAVEKKANKVRAVQKGQRKLAGTGTNNSLPPGAIYTHHTFVQGGAPGLGGVQKPIRIKSA